LLTHLKAPVFVDEPRQPRTLPPTFKYNTANLVQLLQTTCAPEEALSGRTGAVFLSVCRLHFAYQVFDAANQHSVVILLD
jgi:hypothetical protein